jgi:hypothetical protein
MPKKKKKERKEETNISGCSWKHMPVTEITEETETGELWFEASLGKKKLVRSYRKKKSWASWCTPLI